jgi:hypothetical protein
MARKNCVHIVVIFATTFADQAALAASNQSTTKPSIAYYSRPLDCERHRRETDKQIGFLARRAGYSLFLSPAEALIVLQHRAKSDARFLETTVSAKSSKSSLPAGPAIADRSSLI